MNAVLNGPATVFAYSDRYACTVISVSDKEIIVSEDIAKCVNESGIYGNQQWEYTFNENGRRFVFRQVRSGRLKGQWRENGLSSGLAVTFLYKEKYYDPSF